MEKLIEYLKDELASDIEEYKNYETVHDGINEDYCGANQDVHALIVTMRGKLGDARDRFRKDVLEALAEYFVSELLLKKE